MNHGSTSFLKIVIVIIGLIVLAGLLWFPQTEGRAKDLDLVSIYLDPVIAYIYVASISFFAALYHAFRLLIYIEQNKTFTQVSVKALRNIKYSALALSGFVTGAEAFIIFAGGDEDKAGAVVVGFVIIFAAFVIATAAALFQTLLQNAVDIKSENDLTV